MAEKEKIRVAILFGGKSAEHEVSLQSARNVIDAIDKDRYEVVLIGIDKSGQWFLNDESRFLLHADNPSLIALNKANDAVTLVPSDEGKQLVSLTKQSSPGRIDVVFPILHGPFGEDGTVQGLLKLADVPFVGASVLGSAVSMDKDVMKRLLRDAGVPSPKFLVYDRQPIAFKEVSDYLGLPFFIKPANLGSSVGIHKIKDEKTFSTAVKDAFLYDKKVIFEEYIRGREIECSVLGNEDPIASVPGEIVPQHEFYSYEAKYIDEHGAELIVPAKLPDKIVKQVQELAVTSFKVLCCEGMARVDFFLRNNKEVIVNEVNTIPGFTKISMYPRLWQESGMSYTELIDRLIELAIDRHRKEKKLRTDYTAV
jgi:D-alanine-D-alanine ligase